MKRRTKTYYACLNTTTNSLVVSTNKQAVALHIGIHPLTLTRHLNNSPLYIRDEYIVWGNVEIVKRKKRIVRRKFR